MLWMNWGASPPRGRTWPTASRTTPTSPATASAPTRRSDAINVAWATERMREMEPLASGIQLADENLGRRPARFVSDEHLRRLDEIRARLRPRRALPPVDGPPCEPAVSCDLEAYLERPLAPLDAETAAAVERGPDGPRDGARRSPSSTACSTPRRSRSRPGWCTLADGVGYVAVRTPMPAVSARDGRLVVRLAPARADPLPDLASARPTASNSLEPPPDRGPRPTGGPCTTPSRTSASAWSTPGSPSSARREMGMSTDALDDPRVATIVCGYAGDDRRRMRHTPMFHVFLRGR